MRRHLLPMALLLVAAVSVWAAFAAVWFHCEVGDDMDLVPTGKLYASAGGLLVLGLGAVAAHGLLLRRLRREGEPVSKRSMAVMIAIGALVALGLTKATVPATVHGLVLLGDAHEGQDAWRWYLQADRVDGSVSIPLIVERLDDPVLRGPAFVILASSKGRMEVAAPGEIVGAQLRGGGEVLVHRRAALDSPSCWTDVVGEWVDGRGEQLPADELRSWFADRGLVDP